MGGVNMDISLSQLGLPSASAMGRADEAERTRRLHNIIETLKQKPGRVSEENVLALCNRLDIGLGKEGDNLHILSVGESNLIEVSTWVNLMAQEAMNAHDGADIRRSTSRATKSRRLNCKAATISITTA